MVHVSDVPSGLACGCICPSCRRPLVARKGRIKVHHFAHQADPTQSCNPRVALESALHKFAKQVLIENRRLLLPEVVAEFGGRLKRVSDALEIHPEAIAQEVTMPGMRPDLLATASGRQLCVEIAVTHFCGPEKLELFKARQLAAIEIDLSDIDTSAAADVWRDAILRSAPRSWLYNRKLEAAMDNLRARHAEDLRREAEEIDQQAARAARRLMDILAGPALRASAGQEALLVRIEICGLTEHIGIRVPGSGAFAVAAVYWQAEILLQYVAQASIWEQQLFRRSFQASPREWLKPAAEKLRMPGPDVRKAMSAHLPEGAGYPEEAINAYITHLRDQGVIYHLPTGPSRMEFDLQTSVSRRLMRHREIRAEVGALEKQLNDIGGFIGAEIDIDRWFQTPLAACAGRTPEQVIEEDPDALRDLRSSLTEIRSRFASRQPHAGDPLGLPIAQHNAILEAASQARASEARRLSEEARLKREAGKAAAAAELRQRLAARVDAIRRHALNYLGRDDGAAWLASPRPALNGSTIGGGADGITERQVELMELELSAEFDAKVARLKAQRERERILARLAAAAFASFLDPDRADVWTRSPNAALDGRRPSEIAVDEPGLERCLTVLRGIKAGRRASRR